MTLERTAGICFCIVFTSAVAAGQQRSETTDEGPQEPARSVSAGTYAAGNLAPWRRVRTRTESAGRAVVVETAERPDVHGRLVPISERVVETTRAAPHTAQTRRSVFEFTGDDRRRLLETSESLQEALANGDTSAVHNTWAPDLDGRLGLASRQIKRTSAPAPGVRQTVSTLLRPSINETLRETERTEYTERRINPGVVQHDRTHQIRDVNGSWQPIETRRVEAREIGPERIEEETIQRRDSNGNLADDERNVTRRFNAKGQDHVVIETYAPFADGLSRSDGRLALSQRVHRTTTVTGDGRRSTVEEVEGRNRIAPDDPMRVLRRTVTTVRKTGDRWVTEQQVFERDVNGGMRLVSQEIEERTDG